MLELYIANDCQPCKETLAHYENWHLEPMIIDISSKADGNRKLITDAGGYKTPVPYLRYTDPPTDILENIDILVNDWQHATSFTNRDEYGPALWIDFMDPTNAGKKVKDEKPLGWRDREGTIHMYEGHLIRHLADWYWTQIAADKEEKGW